MVPQLLALKKPERGVIKPIVFYNFGVMT